jgi:hypothetical protein
LTQQEANKLRFRSETDALDSGGRTRTCDTRIMIPLL